MRTSRYSSQTIAAGRDARPRLEPAGVAAPSHLNGKLRLIVYLI
ncbi:hypothetical protein FRACA_1670006 [Frankia canadensis]|uniref:Uncharacterized protein n=1 Tax=Frankia canadensis TaxID=1836972 RepID=A0A2I2KMW0_9ACTN|nr:hypothetical protein FRACA_1670006 [Frankia canadensis]SOU54294.1 hypothetical protein FRACA_1670006 [Frankia canadensis]